MSDIKIYPALIQAAAHVLANEWAYTDRVSPLLESGVDAYIDRRTDAGNGTRYLVAIDRNHKNVISEGRRIAEAHLDAVRQFADSTGRPSETLNLLASAPNCALAWLCENRISIAQPNPST